MKYQHLVSNTTPVSLQSWLEEELESRGIDGVYTRYILSLLQNDPLTDPLNFNECEHVDVTGRQGQNIAPLFLSHRKSRHRRWKSWDHECPRLLAGHVKGSRAGIGGGCDVFCNCANPLCSDMECKKTVAVECLKSASEEKNGIEKLIDEVCTKLKNLKADCESPKCLSLPQDTGVLLRSLTLSEPFSSGRQMEMYYSAFPALGSKGVALLDANQNLELLESSPKLARLVDGNEGAWALEQMEGKKGSTPEDVLEERASYSHENEDLDCIIGIDEGFDNNQTLTSEGSQPTFIVPKMAAHRVPSVTMFAPFTSATCQLNISRVLGSDDKDQNEQISAAESEERDNGTDLEDEKWEKESSLLESGLTNPLGKELLFLETDLASKFNSALAAIWGTEEAGDPGLELSFKIYSVPVGISKADIVIMKTKEEEGSPIEEQNEETERNINFFIGSADDTSVWSTKLEDVKTLNHSDSSKIAPDVCDQTSPAMSDLLYSLTSHGQEKESSDDLDTDSECVLQRDHLCQSYCESSVDELLKDDYYQGEPFDEKPLVFCLSPEMFFKETENDCMSSSDDFEFESPAELPLLATSENKAGAVYSLWNSPTPPPVPPHLPFLGIRESSVWPASDPAEKVAEWIIKQFEEGPSSVPLAESLCKNSSPNPWNNASLVFGKESSSCPISKDNCTLTYHRGESRFVEVIPTSHPPDPDRVISRNSLSAQGICSPAGTAQPSERKVGNLATSINSNNENDIEEIEENLLTSHKTHFTPIRQESSETESSICDYEAVAVALEQSTTTYLKSKVKDGESVNFGSKLAPSTTLEEMMLLSAPLSLEDLECSKSPVDTNDVLPNLQLGWRLSLYRDKSTSTEPSLEVTSSRLETIPEPEELTYNDEDPMGFSSFRKMRIWSTDSLENLESEIALPPHQIPWKWSTTDDADENEDAELIWQLKSAKSPNTIEKKFLASPEDSPPPNIVARPKLKECNLEALRRELEAEEEQLFRDINLLSDGEEFCCAASDDAELKTDPFAELTIKEKFDPKEFSPKDFFLFRDDEKWSSEDSDFAHSLESCHNQPCAVDAADGSASEVETALPLIPSDKILYSSQLEEEWHKSSQHFDIQVPQKSKSKSRSSPQRRPCSFYLEGNCRRSDCKFSHDLSSITCRFWEDGSCFKGITCPFLHGYLSDEALRQKFGGKLKFALESEADFPSLSNSSQVTPLMGAKDTKGARKDTYTGRILRPKKKKLSLGGKTDIGHDATDKPNNTSLN